MTAVGINLRIQLEFASNWPHEFKSYSCFTFAINLRLSTVKYKLDN